MIEWLLGLESLSLDEAGVKLAFERPLPGWGWLIVIALCVGLAVWSYSKMTGARRSRGPLACLRALLLLLLVVLVTGPQLSRSDESVERDWVLVLVDRSASLSIPDAPTETGGRITRDAQLRSAVRSAWPAFTEVAREREVVWLGFDAGAFDIGGEGDASLTLTEPTGQTTAIGAALDQALARASARPLSSVVLITDGRSVDAPTREAMRRLRAERVPVHAVALGSPDPVGDIGVRSVDAPRAAFAGDVTPVRVRLEELGPERSEPVTVRLIDTRTSEVLDEREVLPSEAGEEITLTHKAEEASDAEWAVEVLPGGVDLVADNNAVGFDLEIVDRPLRVLYIDGYPRWEQRYLRNLLLRESSIVSSALMLASDRRYLQEGNIELDTLPSSPEEWAEYDVIVLGDVRPDVFRVEQLEQLRDHIATRGAGLLWIGGEAHTPGRWWETELGDLIPFTSSAGDGTRLLDPFVVEPTPAADLQGVLALTEDPAEPWPALLADPETGWSTFYYGQAIDGASIKPTAQPLAEAVSIETGERTPLLLSMRFGAGRSVYAASDEFWRYRYGRGEILYERFWVPLIRSLGRESLTRSGRSLVFEATPQRAIVERPVRLRLELLDQALVDAAPRSIEVELVREEAAGDRPGSAETVRVTLRQDADDPRVYLASWQPPTAGSWTASPDDALLAAAGAQVARTIEVGLPRDELREPETDHASLRALAETTGGRVVLPADAGSLVDAFPNRQLRIVTERSEALWDTPLALILVLVLITAEWVGRRLIRLV